MYSRKNKREVVFAKRRISTAYSLVVVLHFLYFLLLKLKGHIKGRLISRIFNF